MPRPSFDPQKLAVGLGMLAQGQSAEEAAKAAGCSVATLYRHRPKAAPVPHGPAPFRDPTYAELLEEELEGHPDFRHHVVEPNEGVVTDAFFSYQGSPNPMILVYALGSSLDELANLGCWIAQSERPGKAPNGEDIAKLFEAAAKRAREMAREGTL